MFGSTEVFVFLIGCVVLFISNMFAWQELRWTDRNNRDERFRVFNNMQRAIRDREELAEFKQKDIEAKELAQRRRVSPAQKDAVLRRDGYKCQICGISREYLDEKIPGLGDYLRLEVDHIIPIAQGGKSDESNLQCLCWRCNAAKGSTKSNNQVNSMRTWGAGHLPGVSKKKQV